MLLFLNDFNLPSILGFLVVAVLAFAYHEFAHAIVADRLGDPTPRSFGRMTLNPIKHLDRTGMIMLILIGFGWATTPINPQRMRGNPRTSHAIVAMAGPAANLVMAALFAIPMRFILDFGGAEMLAGLPGLVSEFIFWLVLWGVRLNLFLIAFNLLPIPPLDGFWVLRGLLPIDLAYQLDGLQQYGFLLFIVIIFILPRVSPTLDVFGRIVIPFVDATTRLLLGTAF